MKRALLLALSCLVFAIGCASQPEARDYVAAREFAHATAILLTADEGLLRCSGTVVGPHAILTATHCIVGRSDFEVDGFPVAIKDVISDKNDHTILLVSREFKRFAALGPAPKQTDTVFIYGNPAVFTDLYREGRVAGKFVNDNRELTVYDMNAWFGDSGSAIFDTQGRIVGVVSLIFEFEQGGYHAKFMASLPMDFSRAEWQRATES